MLRISNHTRLLSILQSIDMAEKDEIGGSKSGGNKTNLSNLSPSKRSTRAGYLTSGGAKKGVKAAKGSDYLTLAAKKAFNHLWHIFTQAPIFQYFNSKQHIQIKTKLSAYAISKFLNQLTMDALG